MTLIRALKLPNSHHAPRGSLVHTPFNFLPIENLKPNNRQRIGPAAQTFAQFYRKSLHSPMNAPWFATQVCAETALPYSCTLVLLQPDPVEERPFRAALRAIETWALALVIPCCCRQNELNPNPARSRIVFHWAASRLPLDRKTHALPNLVFGFLVICPIRRQSARTRPPGKI